MCRVCKRLICPPSCPNFEGERKTGRRIRCVMCGEALTAESGFYQRHGFPYCEDCLECADSETLVRICEISKRKWLEGMGFYYRKKEDL